MNRRLVSTVAAVFCVVLASCGSAASGGAPATTTPGSSATNETRTIATGGIEVPGTKPDGTYPSVAKPNRDGSLKAVEVALTKVATFDAPTAFVARPGHDDEVFIAELAGKVRLAQLPVRPDGALKVTRSPLLDLTDIVGTDGEEGLLGLAFNRTGSVLYVSYNLKSGDTRVDALAVTGRGNAVTLTKRRNVLAVGQPATTNHKGGDLALGPDGYLYVGLGDGGGEGDPGDRGQNTQQLLGKVLRIDPEHPTAKRGYAIPPSNPFADGKGRAPEIWLNGLRNPWRFSFDSETDDLWIGDVGQNKIEEIDRIPSGKGAGANLGWSGYEGTSVFNADRTRPDTVPPLFETNHDDGNCAITGGVIYRGQRITDLRGAYLFADLCRNGINALRATTPAAAVGTVTDERTLAGTKQATQVIAFGTDATGEVYALSLGGTIWRIDPT